jgi:NitT/TauT family transport system substrate-binding protein
MRKIIAGLLILAIAAVGLWLLVRPNEAPRTIKVGYLAIGAGLPHFVALKNGYFREQGLDVDLVEFRTSNDVAAAGASGQIDIVGTGATNAMIDANNSGAGRYRLFLLNNYVRRANGQSTDFVLARAGASVRQMSDFRGRTVAIFPGSVGEVFLRVVGPKLGLDGQDINTVSMPPPQWIPALRSGSIDGVFGAVEPYATQILSSGLATIIVDGYYAEAMPNVPASGGWFIEGRLTREQELRYFTAIQKALNFIRRNERAARTTLGEFTPTPPEQLTAVRLQSWALIDEPGAIEAAQRFSQIFRENGGIAAVPPTDQWIWRR